MAGHAKFLGTMIVPRDQVTRVVRTYMLHPLVIGIFVYLAFVETVFNVRTPLTMLPFWAHMGVNTFIATLNFYILYISLGTLLHWAVRRNIPIFFAVFFYVLIIGVIEMIIISLTLTGNVVPMRLLNCIFQLSLITGISEILALAFFRSMLHKELAVDQNNFPLFWPVKYRQERLQQRLAEGQRGVVLRIEALGQYVAVITDKGRNELRMPLKDAIAELPDDVGIQVHRSLWVRLDQIGAVIYQNGNPRLRLVTGEVFPLGRKMVEPVKKLLKN